MIRGSTFKRTSKLHLFTLWTVALCLIFLQWPFRVVAEGNDQERTLPTELFSSDKLGQDRVTYLRNHFVDPRKPQRILRSSNPSQRPDTTIVLLNWSRLQNVIFQASVYCGPSLQNIVEQVLVWNNQPKIKLDFKQHFAHTGCTPQRLRIVNSPSNIYFQARFKGCIDSQSRYCFLQDDDYITRPEIIRNVHAYFSNSEQTNRVPSPILLLPAHDHLETDLLGVSVPNSRSQSSVTTTSFAWLGYGTFLLKHQAAAFLSLLQQLKLSEEEMNMADNYFTLLSGRQPNTWFTHTIELAHTSPFTAGVEGSERNWKHIERAMKYLHDVIHSDSIRSRPHFSPLGKQSSLRLHTHTTPCISDPCIISSNLHVLSRHHDVTPQVWTYGSHMRDIQARRLVQLGQEGVRWYIDHPVSNAVDGDVETAYRSAGTARAGDHITLTVLHSEVGDKIFQDESALEIAWLVDSETASVMHTAHFESSGESEGVQWHPLNGSDLTCFPTAIMPQNFHIWLPFLLGSPSSHWSHLQPTIPENTTVLGAGLLECHIRLEKGQDTLKHLRVRLGRDMHVGWSVYEVWLRAA